MMLRIIQILNMFKKIPNHWINISPNDSDDLGKYLSLTYKQRLAGLVIWGGVGIIFSLLGSVMILSLNLTAFATLYTIGNMCMIMGTLFLFGLAKQMRDIFSGLHRQCAVEIYLLMIIPILYSIFYLNDGILCIIFVTFQLFAYIAYSITLILEAQPICKNCCETFNKV
jgi:hypothetical protein